LRENFRALRPQPESGCCDRRIARVKQPGRSRLPRRYRVRPYVERFTKREISDVAVPDVVQEGPGFAILDGRFGIGAVVGIAAVDVAIEKAGRNGVGFVGLRRVSHLGRLGGLAEYAAARNKVVLGFVNDVGVVNAVPFGGLDRRLSTNPVFCGMPYLDDAPIVVDMTTSSVAEGKLKVYRSRNEAIPSGWIIDAQGRSSTDPNAYYSGGALLPAGGHKGYILSFMTDVLAGAMIGATGSHSQAKGYGNNLAIFVIDPEQLGTADGLLRELRKFVSYLKDTRLADTSKPVLYPGESEARTRAKRKINGVPIDENLLRELAELAGADSAATALPDVLASIEWALDL